MLIQDLASVIQNINSVNSKFIVCYFKIKSLLIQNLVLVNSK